MLEILFIGVRMRKVWLVRTRGNISICFKSNISANNIQLMHSFEVNIRICQPENSDVHRGKAEVSITYEG